MRLTIALTFVLLVPVAARGSQDHHGAPAAPKAAVAPSKTVAAPPKAAAAPSNTSVMAPHTTAPAPAAPAAAAHAPVAASAPVARTEPKPTVATVIKRVQERVAEYHEAAKPRLQLQAQRHPEPPKAPRVQLEWRTSLAWPAELTRPAPTKEPSAPPPPPRVTLGWMGPQP